MVNADKDIFGEFTWALSAIIAIILFALGWLVARYKSLTGMVDSEDPDVMDGRVKGHRLCKYVTWCLSVVIFALLAIFTPALIQVLDDLSPSLPFSLSEAALGLLYMVLAIILVGSVVFARKIGGEIARLVREIDYLRSISKYPPRSEKD
ncbi:hypothetical protein [Streptomyces canus]|uniref:hypothetical protein n=1 Tax=Streptomyces canus TaxID=58343 RepID=UPI002E252CDD